MSWETHNKSIDVHQLPPAETLLQTFTFIDAAGIQAGHALDLGAGAGIDTVALLDRGWHVTAIDKDETCLDRLREQADNTKLHCIHTSFENMELNTYQLINSTFSLPFCAPAFFDLCWKKIVNALEPGGYFCGHFFGVHDSWSNRVDITTHTKEQVEHLFPGFDIAWQKEIEKDAAQLNGQIKHWHIFAIVAKKQ